MVQLECRHKLVPTFKICSSDFFFCKTIPSRPIIQEKQRNNQKNRLVKHTCNHVYKTCLRLKAINSRVSVRTEKDAAHALPVSWLVLSSFCSH